MKWLFVAFPLFLLSCGNDPEEQTIVETNTTAPTVTTSQPAQISDTAKNEAKSTTVLSTDTEVQIKKPAGIYQFVMPYEEATKILHTIAFYPTTFRLQEEYLDHKDSIVIIEGTWTPSQGYIWLYKDQLTRGRYTWKGDTLQYYSPRLKKAFSLLKQTPASANKVWMDKKAQGVILFAVGNEPFWSVEVNKRDSVVLSMPEWTQPLKVKLATKNKAGEQTIYTSATDSLQVSVYPYFCSDGMSDFIYPNKVSVQYKGKTYHGCGMTF